MQFGTFHMGGEEGLLCCADRGSLKAGVSVVKESLCAQDGSQCGLCEGQDPPSTWGVRIIPILAIRFCGRCRHRAVISGLFLTRTTGEYRGICCLSKLWYGCVGGDVGRHKLSSVYYSYALVVKPLKGLFTQINKLGKRQMLSAEGARIIAIHCQAAKRNSQWHTGNYSKKKKAPFPLMHSKEDAQKQLQALNST